MFVISKLADISDYTAVKIIYVIIIIDPRLILTIPTKANDIT